MYYSSNNSTNGEELTQFIFILLESCIPLFELDHRLTYIWTCSKIFKEIHWLGHTYMLEKIIKRHATLFKVKVNLFFLVHLAQHLKLVTQAQYVVEAHFL